MVGLIAGIINILLGLFLLIFVRGGMLIAIIPVVMLILFIVAMLQYRNLEKEGNKQAKTVQAIAAIGFIMMMAGLIIAATNL
jgi:uncharacterized membrane protein YfcA